MQSSKPKVKQKPGKDDDPRPGETKEPGKSDEAAARGVSDSKHVLWTIVAIVLSVGSIAVSLSTAWEQHRQWRETVLGSVVLTDVHFVPVKKYRDDDLPPRNEPRVGCQRRVGAISTSVVNEGE